MQGKRLPYRTRQADARLRKPYPRHLRRPERHVRGRCRQTRRQHPDRRKYHHRPIPPAGHPRFIPATLSGNRRGTGQRQYRTDRGARRRGTYRHRYNRGKSRGPCPALRTLHARRTGTGNLCIEFGFPRRRSGHGNTRSPPPRHPGERFRDAGHPHGSPRPLRSGTAIHEH